MTPKKDSAGNLVQRPNGKIAEQRERPFFESKAKALAHREYLEKQHKVVGGPRLLGPKEAEEYSRAKEIVPEIPLDEVARWWRKSNPLKETPKVTALIAMFLGEMEGNASARHYSDLKSRLGAFEKEFGNRYADSITRQEVIDFVCKRYSEPRSRKNLKTTICNFFNWAVEERHATTNPAAAIKQRKFGAISPNKIVFLPLLEVERYLRAAERYDPELVAHEAIQLISGVRSDDEMANFDAADVLTGTKQIRIEEGKKRTGETIDVVEDNFWLWWDAYGPKQGAVRPKNFWPRWYRLRILYQLDDVARADDLAKLPLKVLLKNPELRKLCAKWPFNARRRTFCSFHVAKYQSAERTALVLRHRGSLATLFDSYRGTGITQNEGERYFALSPCKVADPIRPILPLRGAAKKRKIDPEAAIEIQPEVPPGGSS